MAFFSERTKQRLLSTVRPLADGLVASGVHPNVITTVGFLVTVGAGACFFTGHLGWGGFLILLGGLFDVLDGYVARASGTASVFGSFYDSTLDRVSEIVVFLGIFSVYAGGTPYVGEPWMVYVVALAMAGSLMISYTRARAEALGIDCKVGLMQRPERVVLLGVAALLGTWADGIVLTWVLIAMAVLTNLTALRRIVWVWRHTRRDPAPPPAGPTPRPLNPTEAHR